MSLSTQHTHSDAHTHTQNKRNYDFYDIHVPEMQSYLYEMRLKKCNLEKRFIFLRKYHSGNICFRRNFIARNIYNRET